MTRSGLPDFFTEIDFALALGKTSEWAKRIVKNMLDAGVVREVGKKKYQFIYTRREEP